jgi:two-component system, OmpR family, response regulator
VRTSNPARVILVVEDEWVVRSLIVDELKDAGWEVLEAGSAEGAIEQLRDAGARILVLFTDIQLAGGLCGWDVADAFRSLHPQGTVVYASGNTIDRRRQVDGASFFCKPYRAGDILAACSG